jgi:hypothetical protein
MKVLYNTCYGGFNFSNEFTEEFNNRNTERLTPLETRHEERTDPSVIALFEEKGSEWSSGRHSKLDIIEIPDDVEFTVEEYDGIETISWSIPKDEIIKDLLDIIKGRKKEEDTSKFTQMMLQNDFTPQQVREHILSSS